MPYIKQEDRAKYAKITNQIYDLKQIETKGDLEYIVFTLMQKFMATREKRYSTLHEVVYAVMHCADEYRRRFLDKREDEARETNGDI
jgi:hypothetical protein